MSNLSNTSNPNINNTTHSIATPLRTITSLDNGNVNKLNKDSDINSNINTTAGVDLKNKDSQYASEVNYSKSGDMTSGSSYEKTNEGFGKSTHQEPLTDEEKQQLFQKDQTGMSVIDIIKQDHRDAIEQWNNYKNATTKEMKQLSANLAIKLIAIHSACEELVVYPVYRKKIPDGDRVADQSIQEHQELKNDLYDLNKMKIDDVEFDTKFARVMEEINTHGLIHEEQEFLPTLAKYCTQEELIDLGKQFISQRKMVPTRPHPSAPTNPTLQKIVGTLTMPFDKLKDATEGI